MGNYLDNKISAFISCNPDTPMNAIGVHLPEEIVIQILSYLSPQELLKYCLVCKDWNSIIKSRSIWCEKYLRIYKSKPPNFPWYVFYALFENKFIEVNLIKNPCGGEGLTGWTVVNNFGDGFIIEDVPIGSPPLPTDVFRIFSSRKCFATSYGKCAKRQVIHLNNLCIRILNEVKPEIYACEWVGGRFDCASVYKMKVSLYSADGNQPLKVYENVRQMVAGAEWEKNEIIIKDYPDNVKRIVFQDEGQDSQFWAGHYGSKMTGATLKIKLF